MEFDPTFHTYKVDGVLWPSVSQALSLLNDFSGIPPDILMKAARFGTSVHRAIEALHKGDPIPALDERGEAYLYQYNRFLADSGIELVGSEVMVANSRHRYCGTIDLVFRLNGKLCLADVKTSASIPATVGPQTAAYADAYHNSGERERISKRYCIHLTADSYRLAPLTNSGDWSVFLSALNCWRFKNGF